MGTVTESKTKGSGIYKITFDWASSTAGAASDATTNVYNGLIARAIFDPDGGGTQPTDAYDVVVNDDDSHDVLHGNGANQSNSTEGLYDTTDGLGCVLSSKLTCVVSNAGDTKGGIVILYVVPLDLGL